MTVDITPPSLTREPIVVASKTSGFLKKNFRVVAFVGVGVLIVGIALSVVLLVGVNQRRSERDLLSSQEDTAGLSVRERAGLAVADGSYADGQAVFDIAMDNAENQSERTVLLIQKTSLALNNASYDDAITYASEAEDIGQSKTTARLLAQAYEAKGDRAMAHKYYQLTVARYTEEEKTKLGMDYSDDMTKTEETK